MAHVNLPKTSAESSEANDYQDVYGNDAAIVAEVNGGLDSSNLAANAVDTSNIINSAVTGAKLAADVVGVYRTLLAGAAAFRADATAGTYGIGGVTESAILGWTTTPDFGVSGSVGGIGSPAVYLDDADYTVSGRTTKLRVRAQVHANATSPGTITYTVGLYPITVAGTADALDYTLGSVVAGSTVAIANPSSSTITSGVGSDFNVPSDGLYVFGCVTSATLANSSAVAVSCQLQLRHT